MNREEALRTLGLENGATEADVKAAYKEMAQILHPDKFKGNKRLEERATEQFKRVNEARDFLLNKGTSARRGGSWAGGGGSSRAAKEAYTWDDSSTDYGDLNTAAGLKARLAGIAAARAQLTAQLDAELDRRRIGIYMAVGGVIAMVVGIRIRIIEPLGGILLVWGAIQIFNTQGNIKVIRENLKKLDAARKECEEKLDNL
jgi:hypothetical protein